MFTGIVEATAGIVAQEQGKLILQRPPVFDDIHLGMSIAVAGVCLTVVRFDANTLICDVVPETLQKTSLGNKQSGDRVNLERSLRANGRFEGHIVQGHVEGTATVERLERLPDSAILHVQLLPALTAFVVAKGSIALDGVSLTVAVLEGTHCSIALIPHTLEQTTLGTLQPGDLLNMETDILGRYVRTPLSSSL